MSYQLPIATFDPDTFDAERLQKELFREVDELAYFLYHIPGKQSARDAVEQLDVLCLRARLALAAWKLRSTPLRKDSLEKLTAIALRDRDGRILPPPRVPWIARLVAHHGPQFGDVAHSWGVKRLLDVSRDFLGCQGAPLRTIENWVRYAAPKIAAMKRRRQRDGDWSQFPRMPGTLRKLTSRTDIEKFVADFLPAVG